MAEICQAHQILILLRQIIERKRRAFAFALALSDGGMLEVTGNFYDVNQCAYHRHGPVLNFKTAVIQPIQKRGFFKEVVDALHQQYPFLSFRFEAILDDVLLEKVKAMPGVTVANEFDNSPMIKHPTAIAVDTQHDEFYRHFHENEVKHASMPERSEAFRVMSLNLQGAMEQRYLPDYTIVQNIRMQQFVHQVCNRLPRSELDPHMLAGVHELLKNKDVFDFANTLSRAENGH
jgi:hypothetical protein